MSKKKLMVYGEAEVNELIHVVKEESRTTSLLVAEKFGKRHDNVLRDIAKLECSEKFRLLNYEESSYENDQGKVQPMCELTRDGFSLLVMGFTGKKAMEWKEKYIHAFNRMEQEIRRLAIQKQNVDWQAKRLEGKTVRRDLTDEIQSFVDYATGQGSTNARWYYKALTTQVYGALFLLEKELGKAFQDTLDGIQLSYLTAAEGIARKAIRDGMGQDLPYKKIYQLAKERVEAFAEAVGRSSPGDSRKALQA